jgi:hypothetical protein
MGRRSDWPLIKHLSKTYGPEMGRAWQRLPLVQLPALSDAQLQEMHDIVVAGSTGPDAPNRIDNVANTLLFDDVIFDYVMVDDGTSALGTAGEPIPTWFRLSTPERYTQRAKTHSPWFLPYRNWVPMPIGIQPPPPAYLARCRDQYERSPPRLILEVWEGGRLGFLPEPKVAGLVTTSTGNDSTHAMDLLSGLVMASAYYSHTMHGTTQAAMAKKLMVDFGRDVSNTLLFSAWLTRCPQYLVEQTPLPPSGTASPRGARPSPKPWTDEYVPRYILLDPEEAPAVAADGESHSGGGGGGPRRSHQRRAHWHELRHARFRRNPDGTTRKVFVRNAWVGPEEWVAEGNHYRVVTPHRTEHGQ